MSVRAAARIAWSLSGLAVVLYGLYLLLLVINQANPDQYWGAGAVVSLVFPVVGAVIVSRYPTNALGWIFCAVGVSAAASGLASQYATRALLADPGSQFGAAAAWFGSLVGNASFFSLVFVPLLFPDGRPPSRRWRPVVWLIAGAVALTIASFAFTPGPLAEYPAAENPFGIEGLRPVFELLSVVAGPIGLFCLLASVASLVIRFWYARGDERQQLKWFTYAIALGVLSLVGNGIFPDLAWLIGGVGTALIPIAIGIAVVKYCLYNIDLIINKTLVYGALTASLALVYFGSVVALQYVFRALTGSESQLAIVVSTLAIAALFGPLRRRIQGLIDRRFYRQKYDAAMTMEAFSAKLRDGTDLERLNAELLAVIRETLRPEHASLWLREPGLGDREERRDFRSRPKADG